MLPRAERDALIAENLTWARRLALRVKFENHLFDLTEDDVIAAGNVALVESAGRYDPKQPTHFRGYAYKHIVGAVLDCAYESAGATGGGQNNRRTFRQFVQVDGWLDGMATVAPTPSELVEWAQVRDMLAFLPERSRGVLEQLYFEGRTLAQVAAVLGVSESRACQIAGDALDIIRDRFVP